MESPPILLWRMALCAGSLPLPLLLAYLGMCVGVHREGSFPSGRFSWSGGGSLSYMALLLTGAACAACQGLLWHDPGGRSLAWAAALACSACLLLPWLVQLLIEGKTRSLPMRLLSGPSEIAAEPPGVLCARWRAMLGEVSVADGYCSTSTEGLAARISAMGPQAAIASSVFGPFHKNADGTADLSWNAPVEGVRWLCSRVHGSAELHLILPKNHPGDEASRLEWALSTLRAHGFEPLGHPMLPSMRGADYDQFYEGPELPTGATGREEAFALARSRLAAHEISSAAAGAAEPRKPWIGRL